MSAFYKIFPQSQRIPVWFLRQVGRYMPQYQKLKGKRSLYDLFHHTESIVEATLLGPTLLGVDAAILFADILSILDGFNISYTFAPGPKISFNPNTPLKFTQEPEVLFQHILDAIAQLKKTLSIPLIVFAAAPFTLASYLIDGGETKTFSKTMRFLYQYPEVFKNLLNTLSEATAIYLSAQMKAGGSAIQLFESSSLRLPSSLFATYVTEPNAHLIAQIKKQTGAPICLFCRCFDREFQTLHTTGADTLHPDYHVNIREIYAKHSQPISLQGNFDPALLLLPEEQLTNHCTQFLTSVQHQPYYIFNTGHGILPETPLKNVQTLVSCLTSISVS